jgi:rhamnosyltransferase
MAEPILQADSGRAATPRVTVAIPTFNGEALLGDLLTQVFSQETDFTFEVIVADSGSTDGTLPIISAFPAVKLIQIPNEEFGHGSTRNLLVSNAQGEIVVFLTQDSVPASCHWLSEMIRPFDEIGPQLGAAFGKQVPRPDCCPTVKRDVLAAFEGFGADHGITIQAWRPDLAQSEQDALGFLSNVNSAARRSVLEEIPFEDIRYAEDQAFGRSVIKAGYLKAYVPKAAVLHSHSFGPRDYFRRMIDEFYGLRESVGYTADVTRSQVAFSWICPASQDMRFLLRDDSYSRRVKLRWAARVPFYSVGRLAAMRMAANAQSSTPPAKLSLEAVHKKHTASLPEESTFENGFND